MRKPLLYLTLFCLSLGAGVEVQAIAVDNYAVAESSPTNVGYALDVGNVYKYKNATAVAVDHYWILTTAHVGDDGGTGALVIDGETYYQQEVVFHDNADLALVRYDKAFPGYYALMEGDIYHTEGSGWSKTTVWHELLMAGFGYAGTVSSSSFTQGDPRGILRWGTNRGESELTANLDVGGTVGNRSSSCFDMEFNLTDTDYEAGANYYDSGGPVFATNNVGEWVLAGINAYRSGADPNWTGNTAVKVADYVDWIKSVIIDYDTDMDGLPDWWETLYGTGPTSLDREGHLDSDGFTNYEEWLADTIPTDSDSFLQMLDYTNATQVVFSSSTNRKYLVEYRTNLVDANESWEMEVDWFSATNSPTTQPVSPATSNRFYRVRVKLR